MLLRSSFQPTYGPAPSGPVFLNWESPQALGLVDTWLFTQTGRWHGLLNHTLSAGSNTLPPFVQQGLAFDDAFPPVYGANINISIAAAPYTIAVRYVFTGVNSNSRQVSGQSNNWLVGPFAGHLAAFNGDFVGNTIAAVAGQEYLQVVTDDGTTFTHYADGVLNGSRVSATVPGDLAMGRNNPFGNPGSGITSQLIVANQAWPAATVRSLYDPATRWDLYRVPSSRVFFDVAAAGAAFLARPNLPISQAVNRASTY